MFTPGGGDVDTDEDPDLAFIDEAQAGDPAEDEGLASEDDDETPPPRPVKRGS